MTKVLANRFKRVFDAVISPTQSAFVPNRAIIDNIVIGYDCLHYLRSKKSGLFGLATLKLDLSKAFDRVEWSCLEALMLKFDFAVEWISLVMGCITIVRFSLLINGVSKGPIIPSHGIR